MRKLDGIQLTERDVKIVQFINEFGFCEMYQIDQKFNLKKPRNYQLLSRLVKANLIKHERVFYNRPGIYRVTRKGAEFSNLPPLAKVPLTTYQHSLMITDLYIKLSRQYPEATWISERQLKLDKYFDGVGKCGHIADGVLLFPDSSKIAIEVELTMKGKSRFERTLKFFGCQLEIKEVWYFCSKKIFEKIVLYRDKYKFLQVFDIDEFRL